MKMSNKKAKIRIKKDPNVRKQEIIEEALILFSQRGYKDTTISELSSRMNISHGLCYRYFKTKNELFVAAAEYYANNIVKRLHSPFESECTAIEKFNDIVKRIFSYMILHLEFEGAPENSEVRASRLYYLSGEFIKAILPIIEQGIDEGIFHCPNYEYITKVSIYGLINTFHAEMPTDNVKDYIINFMDNIRDFIIHIYNVDDKYKEEIGSTWNELKFIF